MATKNVVRKKIVNKKVEKVGPVVNADKSISVGKPKGSTPITVFGIEFEAGDSNTFGVCGWTPRGTAYYGYGNTDPMRFLKDSVTGYYVLWFKAYQGDTFPHTLAFSEQQFNDYCQILDFDTNN